MFNSLRTTISVVRALYLILAISIIHLGCTNSSSLAPTVGLRPDTNSTSLNLSQDANLAPVKTIDIIGVKNGTSIDTKSLHKEAATTAPIDNKYSHVPAESSTSANKLASPRGRNKRYHLAYQLDGNYNPDCETIPRKSAIHAIRCDSCEHEDGSLIVKAREPTTLLLIGRNLFKNLSVALTAFEGAQQDDCTHTDRIKSFQLNNLTSNLGEITISLAAPDKAMPYYFCLRENTDQESRWFHQGSQDYLKIQIEQDILPLYMKIIAIACLLCLSGTFSGLNLGLMSLDKNELQVIMKCGSENERRYAQTIEPVRRRGNYLLCSILFSNTLVNSTISVFLEDLSSGFLAIVISTVLIVLFGEILPQAFCSRHGLAVGAKTVGLTYFCMIVTFPLSYPVSYCLDLALGEEIGHAYDRERLMEFIQVTRDINNLEAEEVNIISGALKIKKIPVSDVMTRIDDVYMLDETAVLDFDTIQSIVERGYSRIPVHEANSRKNIVAVLFAKDLALVDPDDKTPVQAMITFYNHPRMFVEEDTTLAVALNEFKTGQSHMAIVQRRVDDGEHDPYMEITGIVTLEDVIEEIMQMEINDETDTLTDNRRKRRRKEAQVRKDFSQFTNLGAGDSSSNVVSPQLCLAAYQYLATTVEPFSAKYLCDSVLKRLLSQKIFYRVKVEDDDRMKRLYTAGVEADYFIMILEGRVHVTCGKERLFFDGGPFSFFGKAALLSNQNESIACNDQDAGLEMAITPTRQRRNSVIGKPSNAQQTSTTGTSRRESLTRVLTSPLASIAGGVSGGAGGSKKSIAPATSHEPIAESSLILVPPSQQQTKSPTTEEILAAKHSYFVPDYTVEIISNTSYLKVTVQDYQTLLKATLEERCGLVFGDNDIEPRSIH